MSAGTSFGNKLREWVVEVVPDEEDLTLRGRLSEGEQEQRLLRTDDNNLACRRHHKAPGPNVLVHAQRASASEDLICHGDDALVEVKWLCQRSRRRFGSKEALKDGIN